MSDSTYKYTLSFVTIMKFEEDHVAEWIAFHKVCGVEHFYIYDNNDSPESMAQLLKPFIDSKLITLIHWPGPVRMFEAYNNAIFRFKQESKYMMFIDADEFLVSELNELIYETVDNMFNRLRQKNYLFNREQVGGIGINWKVYGTSKHITKPAGLLIRNYLYRGETDINRHIKSIIDPRLVNSMGNPHFAQYKQGYKCVSQSGLEINGPFFDNENSSPLRINHYFYKSEEEFKFRLKRKKADVSISEKELSTILQAMLAEAEIYNQIEDRIALKYAEAVESELKQNGFSI